MYCISNEIGLPSMQSGPVYQLMWRSLGLDRFPVGCVKKSMDRPTLRFDGRVAIVTGAGGGLGKQHALLLAQRGAAVVVNDLGGSSSGEGQSTSAADVVVEQIHREGGKAVANYDSVENGEKILQTALDNFGRIDIIINNAGILRDRSFARISDQDWDLVHRVHLRGAFILTRAAWPHFRKQNYGRIIMTSSVAGIYGNFGQANYSAAKMGLIGLSNTLAIEGQKYNIHSNVIIPMAASRLTEGLMPPEILAELRPEYVAPIMAWLCHESCQDTGGVFEVAGGWVGKYQWQRARGAMLRLPGQKVVPEAVKDAWSSVVDMKDSLNLSTTQDAIGVLVDTMSSAASSSKSVRSSNVSAQGINPNMAKLYNFQPTTFSYTWKDVILYALSVGVSVTEQDHLQYLYENNATFNPLPTFAINPAVDALMKSGLQTGAVPGLNINVTQIVHGEHYLEVLHPLLPEDKLESHVFIADVLDKGSGALIIVNVKSYRGKIQVAFSQFSLFIVGSGKFGGKRTSEEIVPTVDPPSRSPDMIVEVMVPVDQAALFRLNGDINPLHIDPDFATVAGFSRPILHGLCTYGIVAKEVIKLFAGNNPTKFHAMKARFVKPVFPGQTLQLEMWSDGSRVFVQSKVLETGDVVLSGAYVDLTEKIQASPQQETSTQSQGQSVLKSSQFFSKVADHLKANPGLPEKVNALFLWKILTGGKVSAQWTLDLRAGKGEVYSGEPKDAKPQCTLSLEDDDVLELAEGRLNPQKAFFTGKLKISGNVMLTQKLHSLFQSQSKL